MKSRLLKIAALLRAELERAEALADSNNETTEQRYTNVAEALEQAIEAIDEACNQWEQP